MKKSSGPSVSICFSAGSLTICEIMIFLLMQSNSMGAAEEWSNRIDAACSFFCQKEASCPSCGSSSSNARSCWIKSSRSSEYSTMGLLPKREPSGREYNICNESTAKRKEDCAVLSQKVVSPAFWKRLMNG